MEELFELRTYIEQQRYADALALIGEMEEMSKEDKIHKIYSYAVILLLHLIKQQVEKRTTRSWEFSIRNSVRDINRVNERRKSGGFYLSKEELIETLEEAYETALEKAVMEVFEGQYDEQQIRLQSDKEQIIEKAFQLIQAKSESFK